MTAGTVTVSHSLGEISSVNAPASAAHATRSHALPGIWQYSRKNTIPVNREVRNIAPVPSHDYFPSVSRQ